MLNSNAKGKRLELEAAAAVRLHLGLPARRSAQACGAYTADLLGTGRVHVEVKGRRSHAAIRWMDRARSEAPQGHVPLVLLRQDGDPRFYALVALDEMRTLFAYLADAGFRFDVP